MSAGGSPPLGGGYMNTRTFLETALIIGQYFVLNNFHGKPVMKERETNPVFDYQRAFETFPDMVLLTDDEMRITWMNTAACEILGLSLEEAIGHLAVEIVCGSGGSADCLKASALQTDEVARGIVEVPRMKKVLDMIACPLHDGQRQILGALCIARDVTETKQAEREQLLHKLRQRDKELSCIYSISQAVETSDLLHELMKGLSRLIIPGTEVPDETYAAIVLDGKTYEANVDKRRIHHVLEIPIVIEGITRGKISISRKSVYPFSNEEQQLLGRIAESVQRAVLRRELQEQLFFAQKMESIGTLAGGIAHDFNNLMVGVLGSVTLLQERLGTDHPANSLLGTIEESARRAAVLARHLLTYARGGKFHPELLNLNEIIQNTIVLQERLLPPHVQIESSLTPELAGIEADPAQIQQVLINLCTNAAEAVNEEGRICVTTNNVHVDDAFAHNRTGLKPGAHVCITVKDNGSGMDDVVRARIFEPFFTTKFDGRGLGLAIVYGIVKNHKGYVDVDSEVGRGTAFRVYLPATLTSPPPPLRIEIPDLRESGTVLVIDDETMVLDVTKILLEKLGYHILTARNGREAVQLAETYEGDIDVALLDLGMPVMNGHQAFPLLRQRRPEMKILICSGYAANGPASELLDDGAVGFVPKPFDLDILSNAVRNALNNRPV